MHACIAMTKVISLSDDAYGKLKELKNEGESFSEVVNRLAAEKKPSIMDVAGKWVGGKEETDMILKQIYADRKKFKLRAVKF